MKQTSIYTAALAALMLIPAGCSDEQYDNSQQPGNGASGPLITVTATQGDRSQTRLDYNDPNDPNDPTQPIVVTWAAKDQFYVNKDWPAITGEATAISEAHEHFFPFSLKEGDEGKKNAEFTGSAPSGVVADDLLYAFYGDATKRITIDKEEAGALSFDYTNQRQTANGNDQANGKAHLSAVDFMAATNTYKEGKTPFFAFARLGAMIKFTLTLPTEGMAVKQLTLTTTDRSTPFSSSVQWKKDGVGAFSKCNTASASTTLLLGEEGTETGITLTGTNVLTAYMMVAPTSLTAVEMSNRELLLKLTDANGVVYGTPIKGVNIEQGKYYTVKVPPLKPIFNEMKFTIDVKGTDLNFRIPFPASGNTPAGIGITVDWGYENAVTMVPGGTTLSTKDSFKHTYTAAGTYTITITSSQTDATMQQIPHIKFGSTYEAKKLISMDTPMLNTGSSEFKYCFDGCSNLISLPQGLFDNNTQATDFNNCLSYCSSLTSLPPGLFDKNTEVTTFVSCFSDCSSLTSLPAGLFDKNTKATDFSFCFKSCTSLTELPQGLFDKNTEVTSFSDCFSKCSSLTELPPGLFDNNTQATDFDDCFYYCSSLTELPPGLFDNNTQATDFSYCFDGCSSLTKLLEGLFDKNTQATDFSLCFHDCTSLMLNEKIFSAANTHNERKTRFKDKEMNFSQCFENTGAALKDAQKANSVAPLLQLYEKGTATWDITDCYKGCKASNIY